MPRLLKRKSERELIREVKVIRDKYSYCYNLFNLSHSEQGAKRLISTKIRDNRVSPTPDALRVLKSERDLQLTKGHWCPVPRVCK